MELGLATESYATSNTNSTSNTAMPRTAATEMCDESDVPLRTVLIAAHLSSLLRQHTRPCPLNDEHGQVDNSLRLMLARIST